MIKPFQHYQSSIGRKQIVATTGLLLIIFIIFHLIGNLLFFGGPDLYNGYAAFLAKMHPGLYVIEAVLALIILSHIFMTYVLVYQNIKARPVTYRLISPKAERSFAAQIMPYTGTVVLFFIFYHLWDFTFTPHNGSQSVLNDNVNYGLYGLVYHSFTDWVHSTIYIIAMACIGFHLSHGFESFCQTYGLIHPKYVPRVRFFSNLLGILVGWGFSIIPLYVLTKNMVNF